MKKSLLTIFLFAALTASAADNDANDRWGRVRFLLGSWVGTAEKPSKGTVERTYELVLADRFIEERSTARFEPEEKGGKPEVQHHRGFLSYDKSRMTFMLRRLYDEGFVYLFALDDDKSMPAYLIFNSTVHENFRDGWELRPSYEVVSKDEFIETIEVAQPDKDFVVFSTIHFKRKK